MRFEDELVSPNEVKIPEGKDLGTREVKMATTLVDQMSDQWSPERYTDDYRSALMKLIDAKVKSGGKEIPGKAKNKAATNVVDLLSVLEESLAGSGKAKPAKKKATRKAA
jgi:DNA end-binding protein Ku